jgi:Major royal jelly protein
MVSGMSILSDQNIRIHGQYAYLTDAGRPGIILLELKTGMARRVLDGHPSTTAPLSRAIVVDGKTVFAPDGKPLRVHSDPMEVSPDGRWFYFAPLEGPWSRIETPFLDDPSVSSDVIASKVEPWTDLPPIGGSAMDRNGDLYFSDLAACALKRRAADGTVTTIVRDSRLHWVDAPFIDEHHVIWLPVPQLDRVALFHGGTSKVHWPVKLFRLPLDAAQ